MKGTGPGYATLMVGTGFFMLSSTFIYAFNTVAQSLVMGFILVLIGLPLSRFSYNAMRRYEMNEQEKKDYELAVNMRNNLYKEKIWEAKFRDNLSKDQFKDYVEQALRLALTQLGDETLVDTKINEAHDVIDLYWASVDFDMKRVQ